MATPPSTPDAGLGRLYAPPGLPGDAQTFDPTRLTPTGTTTAPQPGGPVQSPASSPNQPATAPGDANFGPTGTDPTQIAGLWGVTSDEMTIPVPLSSSITALNGSTIPGVNGTVQSVLQSFYSMDPATLQQLQQGLYEGGFYAPSYYTSSNPRPVSFGAADEDTFNAFKMAVVEAARAKRPIGDIISTAVQARAALPGVPAPKIPGIIQAGGTYHLNLSSPADINMAVDQAYEKLVGRRATDGERQAIVGSIHGQETTSNAAEVAAGESARQDKFATTVEQRNLNYPAALDTGPGASVAGGPVTQTDAQKLATLAGGLSAPQYQKAMADAVAQVAAGTPSDAAINELTKYGFSPSDATLIWNQAASQRLQVLQTGESGLMFGQATQAAGAIVLGGMKVNGNTVTSDQAVAQIAQKFGFSPADARLIFTSAQTSASAAQTQAKAGPASLASAPSTQPPDIQAILNTIKTQESGNYTEHHNPGGATGAYQYEPGTWHSQAIAAGFAQYANGPAYLAPPAVQDAVAANNVKGILASAGGDVSKVPIVWYTGNINGQISAAAIAANNGLTPAAYQARWMQTYAQQGGTSSTVQATPGAVSPTAVVGSNPVPGLQTIPTDTYLPPTDVTTVAPDTATAAAYAKVQGTPEYNAHNLVDAYDQFQQLIGGRAVTATGAATPQKV